MATPGRGAVTSRNQGYRSGILFGGLVTKEWLIMKKPMVFYYPALSKFGFELIHATKITTRSLLPAENSKPYHESQNAFYVRTIVKVYDFKSCTNPIITI
jgi:hypothetical protein